MHTEESALFSVVLAVVAGIASQILAQRWKIPAIVILLAVGILLGPNFLGWVQPKLLEGGLPLLVKLSVAIILFEGSLSLRISNLRSNLAEVRNLITIGVLVTWFLTTLAAHFIAHLDWLLSILFGALLTVTGPTVVQPLLKRLSVSRKIKVILEGEAILVDPVGAILAVAVLDILLGLYGNAPVNFVSFLWSYFGRLFIGLVVGWVFGWLLAHLLKISQFIVSDLYNLTVLAGVWASFAVAESILSESGIMAAVVMGLVFQYQAVPDERQIRHFKETLTTLCISILFILLAANLKISQILAEGWRGVATVAFIMFVVRPIAVFIATWNSSLNNREKLLIAWIGPRGIIAASVASLFGIALVDAGILAGQRLPALTFLTIILTVSIQGLTAKTLVQWLKLESLEGKQVIIVGCNPFTFAVAQEFHKYRRAVTFIDTNPSHLTLASDAGFSVFLGNALDEIILEKAKIEDAESLLSATPNSGVNILTAQFAYEHFGLKNAFPVANIDRPEKGVDVKSHRFSTAQKAFACAVDISDWQQASIIKTEWVVPDDFKPSAVKTLSIPVEIVPILCVRARSAELVHPNQIWQAKDTIIFFSKQQSPTRISIQPHKA